MYSIYLKNYEWYYEPKTFLEVEMVDDVVFLAVVKQSEETYSSRSYSKVGEQIGVHVNDLLAAIRALEGSQDTDYKTR